MLSSPHVQRLEVLVQVALALSFAVLCYTSVVEARAEGVGSATRSPSSRSLLDESARELRTLTASDCLQGDIGSEVTCGGETPIPACCSDGSCSTNDNGNGGYCYSTNPSCCPA